METAIRWSTNSFLSEQRFLLADVAGRSFKLANITSYDGRSLEYELLSTYANTPPYRAFDWASFDENLVAVGQWSGEATILRIDETATPLSLPTKHQRLCNAVTFNRSGFLATGLERVRNVECLNLWDVNQRPLSTPLPSGRAGKIVEPYRKFSSSGAISSIKFSTQQPDILIAGVKGFGIRIYDLREDSGNASLQFQTSCVHNVAIDPLNENYFACCATGRDTTIQIWDCRSGSPDTIPEYATADDLSNLVSPALEYTEAFIAAKNASSPNIWSSRFCKGKSGFLGALASNGEFKVFETSVGYSRNSNVSDAQSTLTSFPPDRLISKRVHVIERAFDNGLQSRQESERIVAFDFTNLAGIQGNPCAILLRGNGAVSIQELRGSSTAFSLSALGALSVTKQSGGASQNQIGFPDEIFTHFSKSWKADTASSDQTVPILGQQRLDERNENGIIDSRTLLRSRKAYERNLDVQMRDRAMEEALYSVSKYRRRALARYSLDTEKNIDLLEDDSRLQLMWGWIERAQNNAVDDGMIAAGFDLSYLGIYDIWRSDPNLEQISRRQINIETAPDISDAVIGRAESLEDIFAEWKVESLEHRLVCLHTCGLCLSPQQAEDTVRDLMNQNHRVKAAALAMIYTRGKLALEALRDESVSSTGRELSLALAAYLNGMKDDGDGTWHETIKALAKDFVDPYARAILAFVDHGDWQDVLREASLPLRDRVSIALIYLNDDDLTRYINNATEEAIEAGDVEGIVLTGLGPKAIRLFENYIRKYSDLQTAVLALAFVLPRYLTDPKVEAWRQTYRRQLDGLGLFLQRAQFDIQHTRLSLTPNGDSTLAPPARQVSIRCTYCDHCLDRNPDHDTTPAVTNSHHGTHQGSIFGFGGKSGTACPKCGRHMPRCVICMKWVGVPDPHTRGAMSADMAKEEALDSFISVCQSCWHITHAGHAEQWFKLHSTCPATGCECRCVEVALEAVDEQANVLINPQEEISNLP